MVKMEEHERVKLVDEILSRGVGEFVDPNNTFREKLLKKAKDPTSKEQVVIKFGVDPTRPDIHLGHAVVLRKLRQMQDLGCKVVFLVGDITASIGDPTGKSKIRPEVAQKKISENMLTFLAQIDKILLVQKNEKTKKIIHDSLFSWIKNSDWYVGVTDVQIDPKVRADIKFNADGKESNISVGASTFIGKAAIYNQKFSMQINELGNPTAYTVTLINILSIIRNISLSQLVERDMFQERLKSGEPLFIHEMLYPVLQGTDSKVLEDIYGSCDLEVGGTDQTFNMLMGRKVMEITKKKEQQAVLSFKLLVGTDGKEKMSKSLDNYIGITDAPNDMFGKIMSIPDTAILSYFELCTFTSTDEIEQIKKKLKDRKNNPRDIKMDLAQQVVEIYHGRKKAEEAKASFVATFQNKKLPDDMPEVKVAKGTLLVDALIDADILDSKSEFRRLMGEGAIRKNGEEKLNDPTMKVEEDMVLKVGKHRFIKIVVN